MEQYISALLQYGLRHNLLEEADQNYVRNRILELFHMQSVVQDAETEGQAPDCDHLSQILDGLTDYAAKAGLLDGNSITERDLFDTALMGCLIGRPSEIRAKFRALYEEDPKKATDWYYSFSQDTNYIRRDRIAKDMKWTAPTEFGDLDITINLSKPEKDPKAIAAAKNAKQTGYPKCLLCKENEGYAGHMNHPARQNHRIMPVTIAGSNWFWQYSPYVYYNEHCIVFNGEHVPMQINRATFCKLFDFIEQFPHYFVGSNADLPIVGGSILSHDHFQGGGYRFAMMKAPVEDTFQVPKYEDVSLGIVKWPMSVIRLTSKNREQVIELADHILKSWRAYTDEDAFIFANTNGELHNTITPIAFMQDGKYALDLVLRCNITTAEHPLGVFHPHAKLHHIKKENIGLIEVMGLAVLPARLKKEMEDLTEAILEGRNIREDEVLSKHADWVDTFSQNYKELTRDNLPGILQKEIGMVFCEVLEDAGVYKRTPSGKAAFMRFIEHIQETI